MAQESLVRLIGGGHLVAKKVGHFLEQCERLVGVLLLDALDGEARVYEHEVAHLGIGHEAH